MEAATQESLHTTQNSVSGCYSEVAVAQSDLEDAVHDVLDTKVNEKPLEDLKHCVAYLAFLQCCQGEFE